MRLLKLGIYHPTYVQDFYAKYPERSTQPYSVQHAALIDDCFGSSDFWTNALSQLGYETTEIIANAGFLQRRWALENGFKFVENDWLFAIAAAQIKGFRPDVLLVADYSTFTASFLRDLRRSNPSIKLILGWCGAPYNNFSVFREWDIALSCVPELVAEFRVNGLSSFHVNHAFDRRVLKKLNENIEPEIDFAFIGSILKQKRFHIEREQLLLYLVEHTNLQIWSDIRRPDVVEREQSSVPSRLYDIASLQGIREWLMNNIRFVRRMTSPRRQVISEQNVDEEIARRAHPPSFGIEMFQQLRNSKVVFNNHIDISRRSASNMRLFETTGVGTCLITDSKDNLSEIFEADKEVLTYRSAEECVEKVNYILEHETERRSIAAAGQSRTLRDHSFDNRAARIDEVVQGALRLGS
jgi:spore maturation protein CgeB